MHRLPNNAPQQKRRTFTTCGLRGLLLCGIAALLLAACNGMTTPIRSVSKVAHPRPVPARPIGVLDFKKPISYVALGASDAVGVGSKIPSSQGYVPLIAARLPNGSHALNLGVSGILLHEALSKELPRVLNASPQLITVWLVANDFIGGVSYQSYIGDLNSLLSQLRTRTQARIVMADLPDITRLPALRNETPARKTLILQVVKQWDRGIAQVATRYDVTLVDLLQDGSELTDHPEYISSDGFHPSTRGYQRLASLFWQAIQKGTP